jgi:hypothetical protein
MAYDDDDDLFSEEFDFVDEDDDADRGTVEDEQDADSKPRKRASARDKDKPEKGSSRAPKRGRPPASGKRESRRESAAPKPSTPAPPPAPPLEKAPVGYIMDDEPVDEATSEIEAEAPAPEPVGPPADHVVHVYEYGQFKRTIPRKFTDEEAVSFAEEYTRTGKAYGRYAIATPEDEEPAPTFAAAAKG